MWTSVAKSRESNMPLEKESSRLCLNPIAHCATDQLQDESDPKRRATDDRADACI
jgi:hypothetical protein